MKSFITIITLVVCSFVALAVPPQEQTEQTPPPLDANNRDSSVKPGDDFFLFANGNWIKQTEIPPEYSRWGAFNELIERNNDALHTIAEKASQTKVDPKEDQTFATKLGAAARLPRGEQIRGKISPKTYNYLRKITINGMAEWQHLYPWAVAMLLEYPSLRGISTIYGVDNHVAEMGSPLLEENRWR